MLESTSPLSNALDENDLDTIGSTGSIVVEEVVE
jgi:hypothetical protein